MGKTPFTLQRFTDCNNNFLHGGLFRSPRFLCFWACALLALFIRLGSVAPTDAEEQMIAAVKSMLASGDWLHTVLDGKTVLRVPFLHDWFVAVLSVLSGEGVTVFIERLPSVMAGIVIILCVTSMTKSLFQEDAAFISSWLLLTTIPFLTFSRTAGADVMGAAFAFSAIAWYVKKRDGAGFLSYTLFFLLCACGALTNGIVTAVIPCLIAFIDVCVKRSWKRHYNFSCAGGALVGITLCLMPFILEMLSGNALKTESMAYACCNFFFCTFSRHGCESIGNAHPIYLSGLMLPWTAVLIPAFIHWISKFIRHVKGDEKAASDEELFFMLSCFSVIIISITSLLFSKHYTFIQLPFYAIMTGVFLSTVKDGKLCKFTNAVFDVMAATAFLAGIVLILSPFTATWAYRQFSPELLPFTKAEANLLMLVLPLTGLGIASFVLLEKGKIKKGRCLFTSMKHVPFCGVVIVSVFVITLCASNVFSFFRIFG